MIEQILSAEIEDLHSAIASDRQTRNKLVIGSLATLTVGLDMLIVAERGAPRWVGAIGVGLVMGMGFLAVPAIEASERVKDNMCKLRYKRLEPPTAQ